MKTTMKGLGVGLAAIFIFQATGQATSTRFIAPDSIAKLAPTGNADVEAATAFNLSNEQVLSDPTKELESIRRDNKNANKGQQRIKQSAVDANLAAMVEGFERQKNITPEIKAN